MKAPRLKRHLRSARPAVGTPKVTCGVSRHILNLAILAGEAPIVERPRWSNVPKRRRCLRCDAAYHGARVRRASVRR
jgi:hypothetical protein